MGRMLVVADEERVLYLHQSADLSVINNTYDQLFLHISLYVLLYLSPIHRQSISLLKNHSVRDV